MKNWKTTVFGAVAMVPQLIKALWPECPAPIFDLITAVAGFLAFMFAKDKDVTGGTKQQ